MALDTFKCNHLTPLHFKLLIIFYPIKVSSVCKCKVVQHRCITAENCTRHVNVIITTRSVAMAILISISIGIAITSINGIQVTFRLTQTMPHLSDTKLCYGQSISSVIIQKNYWYHHLIIDSSYYICTRLR